MPTPAENPILASAMPSRSRAAVLRLQTLYEKSQELEPSGRLTDKVIQQLVGCADAVTVHRWRHEVNAPKGANLRALEKFLDEARDARWLAKAIHEVKNRPF